MPPTKSAPEPDTLFSDKLNGSLDQITNMIEDNAKMIDLIQEVALELTNSIGTLHTLTVKYAGTANSILDVLLPIFRNLPILPKDATKMLTNLESITQKISDSKETTGKTIAEVQTGLRMGDVTKLQNHAGELQNLTRTLTAILPK
jgi:hypothetical protein